MGDWCTATAGISWFGITPNSIHAIPYYSLSRFVVKMTKCICIVWKHPSGCQNWQTSQKFRQTRLTNPYKTMLNSQSCINEVMKPDPSGIIILHGCFHQLLPSVTIEKMQLQPRGHSFCCSILVPICKQCLSLIVAHSCMIKWGFMIFEFLLL